MALRSARGHGEIACKSKKYFKISNLRWQMIRNMRYPFEKGTGQNAGYLPGRGQKIGHGLLGLARTGMGTSSRLSEQASAIARQCSEGTLKKQSRAEGLCLSSMARPN